MSLAGGGEGLQVVAGHLCRRKKEKKNCLNGKKPFLFLTFCWLGVVRQEHRVTIKYYSNKVSL